jgi:Zn-dependent protease with chaperone function
VIEGVWYPAGSSARVDARLELSADTYELHVDGAVHISGESEQLSVSDRVGNIARRISLPDGSLFETRDNQAVDAWLAGSGHANAGSLLLHFLESNGKLIVFAVVFVLAFSVGIIRYGLPWASEQLAYRMPAEVTRLVGEHTLDVLNEAFLTASELSEQRQQEIKDHFQQKLAPLHPTENGYRLHFKQLREMPEAANAFALPSGDIIVTDALVAAVRNQEQLDSVLLHEMGHIAHRHGMRRVIHASSMTFIMLAVFGGELSGMDQLLVGFPVFLMQQHYSRQAEEEADGFAIDEMLKAGMDPNSFAEMFEIVFAEGEGESGEDGQGGAWLNYLSSHPATRARIEAARRRAAPAL